MACPPRRSTVLYPRLIAANPASVAAFTCTAAFRDIGTASDYLSTSAELAAIEGDRMVSGNRVDDRALGTHRPHGCVG